jgi:hypothetical protein
VVALDLPPVREFVTDNSSAHLIPCDYSKDILGRPTATLNIHNVTEALNQTIGDCDSWFRLTNPNRELAWQQRKADFEKQWSFAFVPR